MYNARLLYPYESRRLMVNKRIIHTKVYKTLIALPALMASLFLAACDNSNSIQFAAQVPNVGLTPSSESDSSKPASNASNESPLANSRGKVFGLSMGTPLAQLDNIWFIKKNDMYIGFPPERSDLFSRYGIIASKKSGLCDIFAMTSDMEIDNTGDKTRDKVDEIAKILAIKYGAPSQKIETPREGPQAINPAFWSLSLSKGEARYGYAWKSVENGTALPSDLESITIMAFGVDAKTSRANLRYSFKNTKSCEADLVVEKAAML
jgi:hypothetical protein